MNLQSCTCGVPRVIPGMAAILRHGKEREGSTLGLVLLLSRALGVRSPPLLFPASWIRHCGVRSLNGNRNCRPNRTITSEFFGFVNGILQRISHLINENADESSFCLTRFQCVIVKHNLSTDCCLELNLSACIRYYIVFPVCRE